MRPLAIGLLCALTACDFYPAMRESEAAEDAQQHIASGDCRLLGVYGVALETPGAAYEEAISRGVRPIEGTSDVIDSPSHERFNRRARRYAERYNLTIKSHCQ